MLHEPSNSNRPGLLEVLNGVSAAVVARRLLLSKHGDDGHRHPRPSQGLRLQFMQNLDAKLPQMEPFEFPEIMTGTVELSLPSVQHNESRSDDDPLVLLSIAKHDQVTTSRARNLQSPAAAMQG